MDIARIELVQSSFEALIPRAEELSLLFYERLFELDPSLRKLFSEDVTAQGKKLMNVIGTVVSELRNPERVMPMLSALARRHIDYGAEIPSFATVGDALLWSLKKVLASDFTEHVKDAWAEAYQMLADAMTKVMNDCRVNELKVVAS